MMADHWMTPFIRDSFTICPYVGMRRYLDDLNELNRLVERDINNSFNMTSKTMSKVPKFFEPCPEIVNNDKEFIIKIDVSHFATNELKVSVKDRYIQVEGQHDEKVDKYGTIRRNFTRKFALPPGVTEENVTSELTKDGILTIKGTKLMIDEGKGKNIKIECKK